MAKKPFGQVVVDRDDLKQFHRAVRKSADQGLPKRLGQANKSIGRRFIDEWLYPKPDPRAVGEGAGAAVRPSASKRDVVLRVGGKHRAAHSPQQPWGKRVIGMVAGAPPRPYIRESIDRHEEEIRDLWLEAVADALDPAFAETEP